MEAVLTLLTSPLVVVFGVLAAIAVGAVARIEARHQHYFANRHPSGVWACTGCPATRDRHGRIHP